MIHIMTNQEHDYTIVSIAGQIAEEDVPEMRRVRADLSGTVVLNLDEVTECSGNGLSLLRAWLDDGARIRKATPYLRMILNNPSEAGL